MSGLFARSHCKGIDAGRVRICDQIYSLPQYESYFIYSLPYWWPFRLLPTLYHYKNCCNEHLFFFNSFLREVLDSQQIWVEGKEIPHILLGYSLLHYQHPSPGWYLCYNWPYIDTSLSFSVHTLHYGSLLVSYILWVWTHL